MKDYTDFPSPQASGEPAEQPLHRIHRNSIRAYREETDALGGRALKIFLLLREAGPLTDRETKNRLGYGDMNTVRPRITWLIGRGLVEETGRRKCPETGKMVRLVAARAEPKPETAVQQELISA